MLVFPTPVGVFPRQVTSHGRMWSSPRPWGCFPFSGTAAVIRGLPHARGVFLNQIVFTQPGARPWGCFFIFSPAMLPVGFLFRRITYLRRGVFPRPWGCFWHLMVLLMPSMVFPTPVGVFSQRCQSSAQTSSHARGVFPTCNHYRRRCLPHARGVFPLTLATAKPAPAFFPTPVGVFQNYQRRFCNHPVFPPVGSATAHDVRWKR